MEQLSLLLDQLELLAKNLSLVTEEFYIFKIQKVSSPYMEVKTNVNTRTDGSSDTYLSAFVNQFVADSWRPPPKIPTKIYQL
jgi:hypothetical protein